MCFNKSNFSRSSAARHMGGYREPTVVAACPDVGVTAVAGAAVRDRIACASIDDGEIAHPMRGGTVKLRESWPRFEISG